METVKAQIALCLNCGHYWIPRKEAKVCPNVKCHARANRIKLYTVTLD